MNKNILSIYFKYLQKHVSFIFLFMLLSCSTFANNILVENVITTGLNETDHYIMVQFNISWDNSWKTSSDYTSSSPTTSVGIIITVPSTVGLRVGMLVTKTGGSGTIPANTTVISITDATHFVVSAAPSPVLSNNATITGVGVHNYDAAWVFVKYKSKFDYVSDPGATSGLAYASANTATSSSVTSGTFSGASSTGTIITVTNTTGLVVGMQVIVTAGTGVFPAGTTVTAISENTFTVSAQPTTALSGATITSYTHTITFTAGSTTNLSVGMHVVVTAGTGAFKTGTYVSAISGNTFTVSAAPTTVLSGATVTGYAKITVTSTLGLCVGMPVSVTGGGEFATGTVVTAITGATTFSVSAEPSTPLTGLAVVTGTPVWSHATINLTGNNAPSGTITPAPDGTGAFIYRSADGTGTNTWTGAQLRWNYLADGVADGATVAIKVFAIEMVYVPQGSFSVGSGGTESGSFTNGSWTGYPGTTPTIPLSITSENELTIANTAGKLWYTDPWGWSGDRLGPIPVAFPKGYNAFYCMKYEIMQQQYVDFLNILTQTQATARKYDKPSLNYRYEITGGAVGSYATANPFVACNWLSWSDLAAYLDWSGLRPMTELEFEKSCRGTLAPVANEYAWGTTGIANSAYTLSNSGANNENIATNYSTNLGNVATWNTTGTGINGPIRVGIFAGNGSNTGRITSGATYYGIMEMSGNLWERSVTVGKPAGRGFTGTHGNGVLTSTGDADASTWPGIDAVGNGIRGGEWSHTGSYVEVSDRRHAASGPNLRELDYGGRGVRTAP